MQRVDPVVRLLFIGTLTFAILMVLTDRWMHDDAVVFQALSGLAANFSGALFLRVNPPGKNIEDEKPPPRPPAPDTHPSPPEPGA